jgi:hypothetical protein
MEVGQRAAVAVAPRAAVCRVGNLAGIDQLS